MTRGQLPLGFLVIRLQLFMTLVPPPRARNISLLLWYAIRWDDTARADGAMHRYILHFFLEDGTVEMRELADAGGGEPTPFKTSNEQQSVCDNLISSW